jgi:hypothetical protein
VERRQYSFDLKDLKIEIISPKKALNSCPLLPEKKKYRYVADSL